MVEPPDDSDSSERIASDDRRTAPRPSLRSPSEALHPGAPPPPPRPLHRRRRPLVATASGLLSFLGIAAIACALAWSMGLQRINAPGPLPADKVVTVRAGNERSVVDQLTEAGVVDNGLLMTAALWLEGARSSVKSGEYLFKQNASIRDVIDLMVSGKQVLHAVTIPEGLTSEQVMERLRDNDVLIGDISINAGEGTLMPDTYKFARGTTRDQVIRSMQAEEKRVLAEVWAHRSVDTPIHSPFELVTLASIVEKETGRADERPRVAGVFVNRLARNMPLQSDPTVVYGLVGGKGTLGRGILKSELEQRTPYNTYVVPGLPPGPIANPGRAALEAVANPSRTRELYFVADGTGGHAFAENLDQHRLNVTRWRQIEKDRDKPAPDDKAGPAGPAGAAVPARPDQRGEVDTNPDKGDEAFAGDPGAALAPGGPAAALAVLPTFAQPNLPVATVPGTQVADPLSGRFAGAVRPGGTTFDELDVEVGGLKSRADPATWDDGEGGEAMAGGPAGGGDGSPQTFPVSPQHLADQRARAVALGLMPASSPAAAADAAQEAVAGPPAAEGQTGTGIKLYGKGKIIDASEGTSFDPLRDKSYDLTTAKVVPPPKALLPLAPLVQPAKATRPPASP